MSDDGADEEPVVHHLGSLLDLGRAEVDVEPVVVGGDRLEVEVAHAVEFELEGERRLQVPVDAVLVELNRKPPSLAGKRLRGCESAFNEAELK